MSACIIRQHALRTLTASAAAEQSTSARLSGSGFAEANPTISARVKHTTMATVTLH